MTEKEEKLVSDQEIYEMFNTSFLPKLQEFAKRAKKEKCGDLDVKFFNVKMHLQFSELDEPLTYQMIQDKVQLQMMPITQEDLDRASEQPSEQSSDLGDEK